jgi:curli biogenesis system outer membrane secretion channel CsgG
MARISIRCAVTCAAAISLVAADARGQGITGARQGQGGTVVQGAAGTGGGKDDQGLEHCDAPMGAVAVVEPQSEYMIALGRYGLQSPTGLIRLMIQQSNCFVVVERGQAMRNMMQERDLAAGGQTRQGSNLGGGQMVAADFLLTPAVVFSEGNAGGLGGAVSGFLGRRSPIAGAVAGGLKFKEAQTSMLLADSRSGVQVAAAEGSTRKADLALGAGILGGPIGAAGGGYGNTNEGKIITAALMENYNELVGAIRNDPSLQRSVGTLAQEAAGGGTRKAGAVFNEGDVIGPKIAGVKILAQADGSSRVVATLDRSDELVVIGEEKDGYVNVQGSSASGWVRSILVERH